jgi:hypothetical protein
MIDKGMVPLGTEELTVVSGGGGGSYWDTLIEVIKEVLASPPPGTSLAGG